MDSGTFLAAGIAGTSFVAAVTATLYKHYRPRFPVTVNCWFCNANTKVPYGNRNCWDCPKCDQYNGFSQDGDYNKPIPAQYVEEFNYPVTPIQNSDSFHTSSNVLCERCRQNQSIKIRQLANFVPYSEATFDHEVELYKRHVEQEYQLCRWCEQAVYETVDRQDRALRKQHKSRGSDINSSLGDSTTKAGNELNTTVTKASSSVCFLRWFSVVCSLVYCVPNVIAFLMHVDDRVENMLPSVGTSTLRKFSLCVPVIVLLGLVSSLLSVLVARKEQLQLIDSLVCSVWLFSLFLCGIASWFPMYSYQLLPLIISMVTMVGAMWSASSPRVVKPSKMRIRTVKCRLSPDINQVSSSTQSDENDCASSEVAEEDTGSCVSEEECFSDFETMSLGSPGKQKKHKPDIFTEYTNKVSLKEPVRSPTSSYLRHRQHSARHRQPLILSSRRERPLIFPAKFKPSLRPKREKATFESSLFSGNERSSFSPGHSVLASTSWTGENGLQRSLTFASLGSNPLTVSSERASMFSEPRDPQSDLDDEISEVTTTHMTQTSRQSSMCPVDTTSPSIPEENNAYSNMAASHQVPNPASTAASQKRIWCLPLLLFCVAFSIALAAFYFTNSKKTLYTVSVICGQTVNILHAIYNHGSTLGKLLMSVLCG